MSDRNQTPAFVGRRAIAIVKDTFVSAILAVLVETSIHPQPRHGHVHQDHGHVHQDHGHEESSTDPLSDRFSWLQFSPDVFIEFRTGPPTGDIGDPGAGLLLASFPFREGSGIACESGTTGHVRIRKAGRVIAQSKVGIDGCVWMDNPAIVKEGVVTIHSSV